MYIGYMLIGSLMQFDVGYFTAPFFGNAEASAT